MESPTLSKRYTPSYPNKVNFTLSLSLGVFFLFGAGRLSLCRSQPQQAIEYYSQAMRAQSQYRNLHHISFWEMAITHLHWQGHGYPDLDPYL
jgi:hypothetical protein